MTFKEYYQHYLTLHQHPMCRRLHVAGQLATLSYLAAVIHSGWWVLLIATPFVVYPFAWSGHYFFEKNKPATFAYPVYSLQGDWVMFFQMLSGKIKF